MKILLFATFIIMAHTSAWSQDCDMPMSQINVAGIGLNMSFKDFQRQHPTAKQQRIGEQGRHIAFQNSNSDEYLQQQGVMSAMHIALQPRTERIASYALNFTDSGFATFQTPLDDFKKHLLSAFSLPTTGWIKHGHEYVYRCEDYHIYISQDHGDGRQAMGATITVIGKDSDMFDD